ncbi:MAG: HAMP domain-containing protein [Kofleriaceae bacterium]
MALSFKQRLLAVIVALTVVLVGSLSIYFTSREIRDLHDDLSAKANAYAHVVSHQVTSAVAFSDHETAREVLDSFSADPDIEDVALVGDHHTVLYQAGPAAAALVAEINGARPVEDSSERFTVLSPVESLEGPKGTLAISLSTRRLEVARAHTTKVALATGAVALVFAVFVAWIIASNVARRLRAIANVASAVAEGDLDQPPIEDRRSDEIGMLASAFNKMVSQLKELISRAAKQAHEEQARLGKLVAERTAALDTRNAQMRLVFDNIDSGLFIVDFKGTIAPEHSAAVERWLGPIPASHQIVDYVRSFAPTNADWFAIMWDAVVDQFLPFEVTLAQLPSRFVVDGRVLDWSFKLFDGEGEPRLLVVIQDATKRLEAERSERDERENTSMISHLVKDRVGFDVNYREMTRLVNEVSSVDAYSRELGHSVHTLKGISATVGLGSLSEICQKLESDIANGDEASALACARATGRQWHALEARLRPILEIALSRLDVSERDVTELEAAARAHAPYPELVQLVRDWRNERVAKTFERLAEQTQSVAHRLGKPMQIATDVDSTLRLPVTCAPIWTAMVHAIRNAVDHGIEDRETRIAAGKPASGLLRFRAALDATSVVVEITDDGGGIDWTKIAAAAAARGIPATTPQQLSDALFTDGVTTLDKATEISGRGIGMAALREACERRGGTVQVESERGRGTTVRCRWPYRSISSAYVAPMEAVS